MSRNERDQELKKELEAHLRLAAQDRMDRGQLPADAEDNARREFGNVGLVQEATRESRGGRAYIDSLMTCVLVLACCAAIPHLQPFPSLRLSSE